MCCPMIYNIEVPKTISVTAFAVHIKEMLRNVGCRTESYTPLNTNIKIGLKSRPISSEVLARVMGQMERRGYVVQVIEDQSLVHNDYTT